MKIPAQRFGETRSGKPICTYHTEDASARSALLKNFNVDDDFDAFALFQYLLLREVRRRPTNSHDVKRFQSWSDLHAQRIGGAAFSILKVDYSLLRVLISSSMASAAQTVSSVTNSRLGSMK